MSVLYFRATHSVVVEISHLDRALTIFHITVKTQSVKTEAVPTKPLFISKPMEGIQTGQTWQIDESVLN